VYVAGAGVYLLTIAPAQATEGRAQTNGLDPTNVACNTDALVEGVQFRLLQVNQQRYLDLDITSRQFRNRLAYRCFGIEAPKSGVLNPWRVDLPQYGLIDELRLTGLSDCDVPLALLYWTTSGIQFIDMWAVRRRLIEPDPVSGLLLSRDARKLEEATEFSFLARPRRRAEAYAMCAQFQQHSPLRATRRRSSRRTISATCRRSALCRWRPRRCPVLPKLRSSPASCGARCLASTN